MNRHLRYILAVATLFAMSCTHVGQRLLSIEIEVDGNAEFTGMLGVRDDMPVADMWDELADLQFDATSRPVDITASTRELSGAVVVRITHVDNQLTSAEVSSLSLEQPATGAWVLAPGELDRLKAAAEE